MLEPIRHVLSGYRIVLASSSPRRKEILSQAQVDFDAIASTCEENLDKSAYKGMPWKYAEDTAALKAKEVFERLSQSQTVDNLLVIGSDTVVTFDDVIYGKPKDEKEAFETLSLLSGRSHHVFSGVCLIKKDKRVQFYQKTSVQFDLLSDEVIKGYIATTEPMDKAGGYGIQAIGGTLITGIEGDYYNVMGFPLNMFCKELIKFIQEN